MGSASSKTFVYVSNAIDGEIGCYELLASGELVPGARVQAAPMVMSMAINYKLGLLYAAARSNPFALLTYKINKADGELQFLDKSPLYENFAYISLDQEGKNLFSASYGAGLICRNSISSDGRVDHIPAQIIAAGKNSHAICIDRSNRFVFVPALGSDEIFQLQFDPKTSNLTCNDPSTYFLKSGTGPRHLAFSKNNCFVYVLGEISGSISTFSMDQETGLLKLLATDYLSLATEDFEYQKLLTHDQARSPSLFADKKIWASDIHLTPSGKFLYASERVTSTISAYEVNEHTGALNYLSRIKTEEQPRGFALDASGQYLIASGELSNRISLYSVNQGDGALVLLQRCPAGKGASWVEIVTLPN
jgi:6-phosphogluconolactonase